MSGSKIIEDSAGEWKWTGKNKDVLSTKSENPKALMEAFEAEGIKPKRTVPLIPKVGGYGVFC